MFTYIFHILELLLKGEEIELSRPINVYNEDDENPEKLILLNETKRSYLNIWDEIPSFKDINLTFVLIQALFVMGLMIIIYYLSYLLYESLFHAFFITFAIVIAFLIVFRDNFFSFYLSFKKFGQVNPFKNFNFWRINKDPLTIMISNKKDLRHIGIRMFKIGIIAENVKPNLKNFMKALSISKIPFSYQIIQSPIFHGDSEKMIKTSIYFTISYFTDGFLTENKFDFITKALEIFSYAFKSTCIANLPHYRIDALYGNTLIEAIQTTSFRRDLDYKAESYEKSFPKSSILKGLMIIVILIYLDFLLFNSDMNFLVIIIGNLGCFAIIMVLFWREALYSLVQGFFFRNHKETIDPFQLYKFYFSRSINDTIFIHANNTTFSALKSFNLQYADVPQYYGVDNKFIANLDKFYRSIVSQQIPFTYTSIMSPIDYPILEKEGIKKLTNYAQKELFKRNTDTKKEQWITMRSGIWKTCILFTISEHLLTKEITINDIEQMEERLALKCAHFHNIYMANLPNYHLIQLQKHSLITAIIGMYVKNKFFRKAGTHFNYLLFQGKTVANLIEIANEFKKGIETKIAAEFNSPLELDNHITVGNTINTEFLEQEIPAGFSHEQLKNLLVTNGTFSYRENLLMKIVSELVRKKLPSIVFDYTGNWSKLLKYFENSQYENDLLYFSLGKSFRIQLEKSDVLYDKANIDYLDLVIDAYGMVFKQDHKSINALRNSIKGGVDIQKLGVNQDNEWKKDPHYDSINTLFTELSEQTIIFQNKAEIYEEEIQPYQFITDKKTVIIDLSILNDLEQKLFISFVILSKFIHYIGQINDYHEKILVIPNADIMFDNYYIEKYASYSKISKFIEPLVNKGFGMIISSNQIKYLHHNTFNFFNNIITFRATDKKDIAILSNQMNLQELHGLGYYSSSRKDSYQIDYLLSLKDNEVIIKRYDRNQSFPAVIDWDKIKETPTPNYNFIIEHMERQGYDLREKESILIKLTKKTLFESHFGNYMIFQEEIIKFLQTLGKIDNIGNLYESKIKEELLKIIYPKASLNFSRNKRKIKRIRDKIYELLIRHGYLVESHPNKASGSQSIRTSYSIGPQYEISLKDYFDSRYDNQINVSPVAIKNESGTDYKLEKVSPPMESLIEEIKVNHDKFKEKLIEHLNRDYFYDLSEINSAIKKQDMEQALILQRDILRKLLTNLYCEFHPGDPNEITDIQVEKAMNFFLDNIGKSFTKDYLVYLLSLCKLQENRGFDLDKKIKENFNILLEFFHQLQQDILNK